MPETALQEIVDELRKSAPLYYPEHGELKNIRVVGHTPKTDHFIYDVVADFSGGNERLAVKVYRANKYGTGKCDPKSELETLARLHSLFERNKIFGIPRPVGDFTVLGAIVTEKICGLPLQSMIMKAALLPGFADHGTLNGSATMAGEWLRVFHKATEEAPEKFDPQQLVGELESLCTSCKDEGLDANAIHVILTGSRQSLAKGRKTLPCSAILSDFTPLNVIVGERGVGIADYSSILLRGSSFQDLASFLAAVEALEKYPFCDRSITEGVQERFLEAYGITPPERAVLRVLKMRALLSMFAKGRNVKESAVRKKVMWANVMKRFIQQAAERTLAAA